MRVYSLAQYYNYCVGTVETGHPICFGSPFLHQSVAQSIADSMNQTILELTEYKPNIEVDFWIGVHPMDIDFTRPGVDVNTLVTEYTTEIIVPLYVENILPVSD